MIIFPQVIVTPDTPVVKFRMPKEQIDLDMELTKILHGQGWCCGTYFDVQFVNHEETRILSTARFVVSEEDETLHTSDANPYAPMTKTIYSRKASQISDWWYSELGSEIRDIPEPEPEILVPKLAYDKTEKVHQVRLGDEILFENQFKGKCQEHIRDLLRA